jgi:hypothetical protein
MSDIVYGIQPQDWIRNQRVLANDESVMIRIKYIGSQVAAHITTDATTGDILFEQGPSTAGALATIGDNPGTAGDLDLSDFSTLKELMTEINKTADWFSWLVDCPPDLSPEVSAGNCAYVTSESDQDCTVVGGKALVHDTSLPTNGSAYIGVTLNGDPTIPHACDNQVLHEIMQIYCLSDFVTSLDTTKIYSYDDEAGTKTQIGTLTIADNTATTFSLSGEPLYSTKGKRFGIVVAGTGTLTTQGIRVTSRSYKFGPAVRESKLWSTLETN